MLRRHFMSGQKAVEFTLPDANGDEFKFEPASSDGKPTILFFYPQSGTYGCTKEACQFNDALKDEEVFQSTQARVIGISPDPVPKQKKFVEKHKLTYPILSDEKGEVRKKYNVSRGLMGLTASSRVTFVIDSEGTISDALDTTLNFAAHRKFAQNWLAEQVRRKKADSQNEESRQEEEAPKAGDEPVDTDAPTQDETKTDNDNAGKKELNDTDAENITYPESSLSPFADQNSNVKSEPVGVDDTTTANLTTEKDHLINQT